MDLLLYQIAALYRADPAFTVAFLALSLIAGMLIIGYGLLGPALFG